MFGTDRFGQHRGGENVVELVIVLVVIGLLLGVIGLATALKWLIIVALVLWLIGAIQYGGYRRRL